MNVADTVLWTLLVLGVALMAAGAALREELGSVGGIALGTLLSSAAILPIVLSLKALVDRRRHRHHYDAEQGAEAAGSPQGARQPCETRS